MNIPDIEFEPFEKMARLSREIIVTEKLDGTNSTVYVDASGGVFAGSRNRWITPNDDNYGFALWVDANTPELRELGPGIHRGEWWGQGIQRKYDLPEKRFSLFNVARWGDDAIRPACCHVVPLLAQGEFSSAMVEAQILRLRENGSEAAPGFMKPEGICIYHCAANFYFKKTLEKDEQPKGRVVSA